MTGLGKLNRLCRQDRAAVAVIVALLLSSLLAMVAAGVDLGLLYTTKGELQNAADAAALAGAATLISWDASEQVSAQSDTALATAQQVALANQAGGVNLTLLAQDVTLGLWVTTSGQFDPNHIGASSNPDYLTACRVVLRRDSLANGPVSTLFAGVVGLPQVPVTATATAQLGYANDVPTGSVDLPIAIKREAISGADGPICGKTITFHSENDENSEWTSFFVSPANDPNVKKYVDGTWQTPALAVGDQINVINGNLSNNTFAALADRFQSEGVDTNGDGEADSWSVLLPVISDDGGGASTATVVGFAHAVITQVRTAPDKDMVATLQCGMVAPGSTTGGGNYGTRAATPKLVK
ncbi:MAG: TadG family pilus assembly protein [Thermodesulfobacteriota bacterium]